MSNTLFADAITATKLPLTGPGDTRAFHVGRVSIHLTQRAEDFFVVVIGQDGHAVDGWKGARNTEDDARNFARAAYLAFRGDAETPKQLAERVAAGRTPMTRPVRGANEMSDAMYEALMVADTNPDGWIPRGGHLAEAMICTLIALEDRSMADLTRGWWGGRQNNINGATITTRGRALLGMETRARTETAERNRRLSRVLVAA